MSFIVPAFQAARTLPSTIASIRRSVPEGCPHEVIVVDDGSFDSTPALASSLADRVLNRPCQGGAARARNDGARVARGDTLFFVDADVTVNPAAVAGALAVLDEGAEAVFGAYEALPPPAVRNAATTYKNLLHHHTHVRGAGRAGTFWSGFGAVRRSAFRAVNGFDAAVTTGADVEDIHLGYRLRAAGFRIVLDPTLQVQHHKHYTIRGLIASDVFHRAIPWTRAMLELRTFRPDLNLRPGSMLAAATAIGVLAAVLAALVAGPRALIAAGCLAGLWLVLNWNFLAHARKAWGPLGAVQSGGFMFLFHLYGPLGSAAGVAAYLLRHRRAAMLNWLGLDEGSRSHGQPAVTLAVVVQPCEPAAALEGLPPLEPWWELLVVAVDRPDRLPAGAQWVPARPGASRHEMRQMALVAARGEMFATLDGGCVPDPGWVERVRAVASGAALVVAGSFRHDHRGARHRANQVARYWAWRPERTAGWVVDHPATNAAFRTSVARGLGGFKEEGALILRMAGFGARPVLFDPQLSVRLAGPVGARSLVRGVAGVARLRAAG
ncbi:MAG: glycosyltransferase, partial [Acidimicrobiales bacterium]